jgi:CheY-like chemotaxis protein
VVVDDEAAVCSLVESILADAGYKALATSDPRAALELVRRENAALVLVDISMPHMDGYAVMEALRGDPATRSCPVIFITGHLAFTERVQAFRSGARDYLTKPFTPETLLAKVARVLDNGRTTSS